jgi:hypothetical protein
MNEHYDYQGDSAQARSCAGAAPVRLEQSFSPEEKAEKIAIGHFNRIPAPELLDPNKSQEKASVPQAQAQAQAATPVKAESKPVYTFEGERLKLINAIKSYERRWAFLVQTDMEVLKTMDIESLNNLLKEHQFNVAHHNSSQINREAFFLGTSVVEYVGCRFTNLKLQGLASTMASNQAIIDCVDELSMKYGAMVHIEPEYRLCYLTLITILAVHNANSQKEMIKDHFQNEVSPELVNKYKDL